MAAKNVTAASMEAKTVSISTSELTLSIDTIGVDQWLLATANRTGSILAGSFFV
jgi:hypothetical protein